MILHVSSGLSLTMFSTVYDITHWENIYNITFQIQMQEAVPD